MVYEPKSPPSKIPRFSDSEREAGGIDLGLELGLGTNFDAEMRRYKEKAVDKDRRKNEEEVSMGFTFMQRMEFEQQACIFKYIQCGVKVPYHLLYPLWKSVERSIDCVQFPFFPNLFGGSIGRSKMTSSDPEPGRCNRTDGKKWRCAKEALPYSKYCEKHLHRGRHRSRKLVESSSTTTTTTTSSVTSVNGGCSSSSHEDASFPASGFISLSVAQPGNH